MKSLEERVRARSVAPLPPRPTAPRPALLLLDARGQRRDWSEDDDARLEELWRAGGSVRSIAADMGLPHASVGRRLITLDLRRTQAEGMRAAKGRGVRLGAAGGRARAAARERRRLDAELDAMVARLRESR